MKKHIMPFLLAVWPYLFFLLALPLSLIAAGDAGEEILSVCSRVLWIAVPVLLIGNVIYALRCKNLTAAELARWDFIIKLCHIPVYVLLFLLSVLLLFAIVAPAVLMMALAAIPTFFVFDLVMMLSSSCYGFRALRMAKQSGLVDKAWALKHTIFHCFFVTDVISAFFVRRRLRQAE